MKIVNSLLPQQNHQQIEATNTQKSLDADDLSERLLSSSSEENKYVSISDEGVFAQKMESLFEQMDSIAMRHLSDSQKKEIGELKSLIDSLGSKESLTPDEENQVFNAEERIHSLLDSGFEKLSSSEKQKVEGIMNLIEQLELTKVTE